uniref:Uncharacterized protein n=1 Tax=Alexandrium andersonii TaxID=327968 RepID=A0A7S2AV42_9DINO|mmetsp:Transcript_18505/g.41920  ORF Transcript_18505/g.41920 Transcript_18505/m.41920 type:complete len:118 (+) Transcript_18505:91-444(+)
MASPWECVCEFIRSQSANLQNVLESLGNQNTISDLDTSDTLTLSGGISPLHLFMFLMLAVWGFLYVNGRQRTEVGKSSQGPPSSSPGGGSGSSGSGGSSSSGSGAGAGGGGVSGELF